MIELVCLEDSYKVRDKEIRFNVKSILEILDFKYGDYRDKYKDNGGYVIVVEKEEDFKEILEKTYINCDEVIPEYVDRVDCSDGRVYTNSLILCNNDYSISLIIPLELTPQNFKEYMKK